ncbi:MAG: SoxR reducing system RseC family protein [Candidatus Aminicenantales bacterium]
MKDNGLVLKTIEDLAVVKVECLVEACGHCAAKSLCTGSSASSGQLTAKNPLKALPGDRVELEIPESRYNKALILIFSSLLAAGLIGLAVGYLLSFWLPISSQKASLFAFLAFIILASFSLYRYFRQRNKSFFYPVITDIIKKGDRHGQTSIS